MCGVAFIRLRKNYKYYFKKYNDPLYAVKKLYLLMQKQRNRGQNGAGIVSVKLENPPGKKYISRYRSVDKDALEDIFTNVNQTIEKALKNHPKKAQRPKWIKQNISHIGEVMMGHLRYGTHGGNTIENCHPFLRMNNWRSKNLTVAGNFNLTNVDELFDVLINLGQHPKDKVDTVIVMEKIGHFLDEETERLYWQNKDKYSKKEITEVIEDTLDLGKVLRKSCRDFDGGYMMTGITGYGGSFIARDPQGIRPAYYYTNDEVIIAASEKPAIKTAFNIEYDQIKEVKPGHALIIDKQGNYKEEQIAKTIPEKTSCSFERIYFSRGTDPIVYNERKKLGKLLCPQVLEAVEYDLENTVFSYIPNTAETAFLGMIEGMEEYLTEQRKKTLAENPNIAFGELNKLMSFRPRVEKLVLKDAKLRTFITDDKDRDDFVAHVYDTTYEVIKKRKDNIILIDDSIVRGTTLEKSILKMVDKLKPKRIIIVSSAPQIRFPDCYGIDMSKINEFIAFRAAKALLEETNQEHILEEVYQACICALEDGRAEQENYVKRIYEPFKYKEVSAKIAEIVKSGNIKSEVKVIYQTTKNLQRACPNHLGDWYFTGDYPTQGGNRVVNQAFVNFMKGSLERAY